MKNICNTRKNGLSPLARGTRPPRRCIPRDRRFIPAGAGNTEQQVFQMASRAVYPRWRGELPRRLAQQSRPRGLSPLARGTLEMTKNARRRNRFIPAGAGNSTHLPLSPGRGTVYPRWRGELSKHNLLLINDFLSQSQSTNFTVSHKQHIHYVKERLIH